MNFIDYKVYERAPYLWLLKCLGMVRAAKNMIFIFSNSMANEKTVFTSGVDELGKVDIRREIFQETPCHPYCL